MQYTTSSQSRRRFLTALAAAGVTLPGLTAHRAHAASWRGLVGLVIPQSHENGLQDTFQILPTGVDLLPVYMNFTEGTKKEMQDSMGNYELNVAHLATQQCDLICIEGAPPFMVLGRASETSLINGWEQKYKTPMFTSSQNQVNAFKALDAKNIFGVTPFSGNINKTYADYFVSAGYTSTAIDGMPGIAFNKVYEVPSTKVYEFIKQKFLQQSGADTIYILGSGWSTLDIVDPLEQDLGVPVVHPVTARVWEIQKRLHIYHPLDGYGILLSKLPGLRPAGDRLQQCL
jgi:maleate isomerase